MSLDLISPQNAFMVVAASQALQSALWLALCLVVRRHAKWTQSELERATREASHQAMFVSSQAQWSPVPSLTAMFATNNSGNAREKISVTIDDSGAVLIDTVSFQTEEAIVEWLWNNTRSGKLTFNPDHHEITLTGVSDDDAVLIKMRWHGASS